MCAAAEPDRQAIAVKRIALRSSILGRGRRATIINTRADNVVWIVPVPGADLHQMEKDFILLMEPEGCSGHHVALDG